MLDGQQRITSLAAILTGQPVVVRKHKKPIDILFNLNHPEGPPADVTEVDENDADQEELEEMNQENTQSDIQEELKKRTFVVSSKVLLSNPAWVRVSDIFVKTDKDILKPLGINSDDEKWDIYSTRLKKVRDIESYQYVMQTLKKNLSYEEVTEIFVRVNSLGIKLKSSDLALAQITSKWKGFMGIIEEFAKSIKDDEDYLIESGILVRLLVIFATHQSHFKTTGKLSKEKLEEAWKQVKNAAEFSTNFIENNAQVDNLSLLSSPFIIAPIAVYGSLKDYNLNSIEEKRLLKWLYTAHMRGHYSTLITSSSS